MGNLYLFSDLLFRDFIHQHNCQELCLSRYYRHSEESWNNSFSGAQWRNSQGGEKSPGSKGLPQSNSTRSEKITKTSTYPAWTDKNTNLRTLSGQRADYIFWQKFPLSQVLSFHCDTCLWISLTDLPTLYFSYSAKNLQQVLCVHVCMRDKLQVKRWCDCS